MQLFLYTLIVTLGLASYAIGAWKMLRNEYSPSTFSRVVWVLLAINSFAGVWLSNSSVASVLLAVVSLLGCITMCLISFVKGTKEMGHLEYFCLALLVLSIIVWVFFRAPLVNLIISLGAHFIGAAPTYKKVWRNPQSENIAFWSLFFLASVLSIFTSDWSALKTIIYPLYFALFDGSIMLLAMRRFAKSTDISPAVG